MQVTDPVLGNHKNMFESILDQSSSSHLYYDLDRNQIEGADHHCEPNASPSGDSEPPNVWGTLDCPQPPETTDCKYSQREDFQLEIDRVISVRKEQEAEIVSFVSNCRALAVKVPRLRKASSMQEKRWWSLSPRKTKPIDKQKLPRIHQQL